MASTQQQQQVLTNTKQYHKYCIIFDAFRTSKNDEYVPKKCSVFDITTGVNISTYFVCPPYPWDQLHVMAREVNSFISRYIIGVGWYEGNVTHDQFIMALLKHSESASQIFTKGDQCVSYLTKVLGRTIYDIEPLLKEIPEVVSSKLRSDLPMMECAYTNHERKFFTDGFCHPRYTCCQNRAFLFGNLMRYYLSSTQHVELHKQIASKLRERSHTTNIINRANRPSERLI